MKKMLLSFLEGLAELGKLFPRPKLLRVLTEPEAQLDDDPYKELFKEIL